MSLFPTKTRLALLQAVADGAVTEHYPLLPEDPYAQLDRGPGEGPRYRKVSAAIADQERAGWVRLGERVDGSWYKSPRRWEITDEGRRVLDTAGAS